MCLTNTKAQLCGTPLGFYASKPKKQRGFRWCVRTRAIILFRLYRDRILPSDADRKLDNGLIPRIRTECGILHDEPSWAFVLPYFDKLVHHYATKWVTDARNGSLVSWCPASGCWQWDEHQTASWAKGGVEAVEAWMRQTLGKKDWWQGEQTELIEQFSSMSLTRDTAPSNPVNVPPPPPVNDPGPAVETPNMWASLDQDVVFNPWSVDDLDESDPRTVNDPVEEPLLPVPSAVPTRTAGPMPSPQPAPPSASLVEESTVGVDTVISAPPSTVYSPRRPRTRSRNSVIGNSTVVSSPSSNIENSTVVSSPSTTFRNSTVGIDTVISSPPTTACSPRGLQTPLNTGNSTGNSTVGIDTVISSPPTTVFSRRPTDEQHHPNEAFMQALELQRVAQRVMVETEMAMKEHGLFGYVGYVQWG